MLLYAESTNYALIKIKLFRIRTTYPDFEPPYSGIEHHAHSTCSPCFFTENFVCYTPRKNLLHESKQFDRSNLLLYGLRIYNDWNKYENQYGLTLNASYCLLSVCIYFSNRYTTLRYFDLCSSFILANQLFLAETEEFKGVNNQGIILPGIS